jgi:hypothetical protein
MEDDRHNEATHRLGRGVGRRHLLASGIPPLLALVLVAACDQRRSLRGNQAPDGNAAAPSGRSAGAPRRDEGQFGWTPSVPREISMEPATEREIMRELTFTTDPKTRTPRMIRARAGVDVSVDVFWRRYAHILRVPPDELVQSAPPRPSSTASGHVLISYQQVHLGYPVAGYGYLVDADRGFFRDATGKVMPDLPSTLPNPIDLATALDAALAYLKLDGPPPWLSANPTASASQGGPAWMQPPPRHPPQHALVLRAGRFDPVGADFSLAWIFQFAGTGLHEPGTMDVDGVTGRVVSTTPGSVR